MAEAVFSGVGTVFIAYIVALPLYLAVENLQMLIVWVVVFVGVSLYLYTIVRRFVMGYHDADDVGAALIGQKVWHLTSNEELIQEIRASGVARLDIEKTRRTSRVMVRTRPWQLPRKAAFVFLRKPNRSDQLRNVSSKRGRYLIEIDVVAVEGRVLRRDHALAFLQGLQGPARIIEDRQAAPYS